MPQKNTPAWLKPLLEYGPLIVFFITYLRLKNAQIEINGTIYEGFIIATALFVPLMILSIIALKTLTGHVSRMQILTLILVVIFGGLSLWFNDPRFFKAKPTVLYALFALILGIGLMRNRSYLEYMMEGKLPLSHKGWMILTKRMAGLFLALAILNEIIWRSFEEGTWVYFKTFGMPALLFGFFITQSRLFEVHSTEKSE